jgi:hypothetical protein
MKVASGVALEWKFRKDCFIYVTLFQHLWDVWTSHFIIDVTNNNHESVSVRSSLERLVAGVHECLLLIKRFSVTLKKHLSLLVNHRGSIWIQLVVA